MKHIFPILIMLFLAVLAGNAWSTCENMTIFYADSKELELPCIDVGKSNCFSATLTLDMEALEQNRIEFEIKDIDEKNTHVPTGDDSVLTPHFDSNTFLLKIPYAVIDSTLDTYELVLKLESAPIPNTGSDYLYFTLKSIRPSIMPNVCQEENAVGSLLFYDEGKLMFCNEFVGDSMFVNTMMHASENVVLAYAPCPEGAINSCTVPFPGGNEVTAYSYDPAAINYYLLACGQGESIPYQSMGIGGNQGY